MSALWSARTGARRAADAEVAAELALLALSVVTAFGFVRLFDGWSWFAPLLLAAVAAHLIAVGARRRGWSLGVSAAVSLAGLAAFVALVRYPDTTWFGLPTADTWHTVTNDLSLSWDHFGTAIALVPAEDGYIVAAVVALWVAAFLADSFGFRAGAGPEMLVAPGIIFVFCSALAADRLRLVVTALWLGGAILAFALHRSLHQDAGSGWLTNNRRGAVSAATRVVAVIGGAAIAVALVVGPALPGAGEEALIDTRNSGSGIRQTVSPLVDIQGRLANRSEVEAFTVRSPVPSYWRLTALDEFDGRIWRSNRTYKDANGRLGGGLANSDLTARVTQQVTISALESVWLPAAYSPVDISIGDQVRYDADTSSLVTRRDATTEGMTYTVDSLVPDQEINAAKLNAVTTRPPGDLLRHYTALPEDFPIDLRTLAYQITAAGPSEYDKALMLQNWFRDKFTYDLNVPRGHGLSAIENFLTLHRGYCEQFAGTYAAFARALGIPARVAVGFTPGVFGDDGLYHVQGKHAHAWPEVYFAGVGWLAFEPTPSRGNPSVESYTGVPAQQIGQAPATTVPTGPTSTVAGDSTANNRPPDPAGGELPTPPDFSFKSTRAGGGPPTWLVRIAVVAIVLLVAAMAWILVLPRVVAVRWRRRRRAATTPAGKVLVSWHQAEVALARSGVGPVASETPLEFAQRASKAASLDGGTFRRLAEQVTVAAYAPQGVDRATADDASAASASVARTLWARANFKTRLWWRVDPRSVFSPLPGDGERRRHLELLQGPTEPLTS
jgi:transglutaminase-like putative cysteine protease